MTRDPDRYPGRMSPDDEPCPGCHRPAARCRCSGATREARARREPVWPPCPDCDGAEDCGRCEGWGFVAPGR
jgi:hypothetical protein